MTLCKEMSGQRQLCEKLGIHSIGKLLMPKKADFLGIDRIDLGKLILFDHMDFQVIEINAVDKIVLGKSGTVMAFEVLDGFLQPDRLAQVECIADFIQCPENFMGSGVFGIF